MSGFLRRKVNAHIDRRVKNALTSEATRLSLVDSQRKLKALVDANNRDTERRQLIKTIDERIASARSGTADKVDSARDDVQDVPHLADNPLKGVEADRGVVSGVVAGDADALVGLGLQLLDELTKRVAREVTHDLAPSRSGEGSVERFSASGTSWRTDAENRAPGGAA